MTTKTKRKPRTTSRSSGSARVVTAGAQNSDGRPEELPVIGVRAPDRKWIIDGVIGELDSGNFVSSGRLADGMKRDDVVSSMLEQRHAGLFSCPRELEPAKETALARRIRDEIDDQWDVMFPRSMLEELAGYGFLQGIGMAPITWDTSELQWSPSIDPFHPQFYTWRWDLGAYTVLTADRGLVTVPRDADDWLIHAPYGYKRAFLEAKIRGIVDPWQMRGWNKSDWASWCEVHGRPIRKAIVPQKTNAEQEKQFVRDVANMGGNTVVKTRQDADGNKYDIQLVEAISMGWKGFEAMIGWSERAIFRIGTGQSDSLGQSTGSSAGLGRAGNPGEKVRIDVNMAQNSALSETIYRVLRLYCEYNYGDPDLAPRWARSKRSGYWRVEPAADIKLAAEAHFIQAQADEKYKAMGAVTADEIRDSRFRQGEFSVETAITDEPAVEPEPAPVAPGAFGKGEDDTEQE